jgi:replicative DNA helicase
MAANALARFGPDVNVCSLRDEPMRDFTLQSEFTDTDAERALICAVAQNPALFWNLQGLVSAQSFCEESAAWQLVADDIGQGKQPDIPDGWTAASHPQACAEHLSSLSKKRLIAAFLDAGVQQLHDPASTPDALLAHLKNSVARIRDGVSQSSTQVTSLRALIPKVISDAEERSKLHQQTGKTVGGLLTGIQSLDRLVNGLTAGLYLFAGGPGAGKTTLALQIASSVCREVPVLFLTYENSAENLVLKAVCSRAGINVQDVERGTADLQKLTTAALALAGDATHPIAFIQGTSAQSVEELRAAIRSLVMQDEAKRALVVVDFLQLWAKTCSTYRNLDSVRSRVETLGAELRELAVQFDCPVIAICSQNREQGGYGDGAGRASLDSLKESGDLEYLADVAMFLVASKARQAVPPTRAVDLCVRKNRYGDVGTIGLFFRPDTSTFREDKKNV